jgi:ribosomal protein S18 acetylase RimI-like enzyme
MSVIVRHGATLEDLPGMLRAEHEAWPEEQAFTEEHFRSHLEVFPEGIFLAEVDGVIAGVGVSEILNYDISHPVPTWYEVSGEGFIRRTHNHNGDSLYGVSLSVSKKYAGQKLGQMMIETAKEFIITHELNRFVIGSRLPSYYKKVNEYSPDEYARKKRGSRYLDPEINFYCGCGFRFVRILPDYFEDPASLNNGALMVWDNPHAMKRAA